VSTLASSERDGYTVVRLPAVFDQNDWLALRGRINRDFIDRGIHRVIIDCQEKGALPSIAYGSLTSLSRDFRSINGMLLLVHVSDKDRLVLSRTGIDQFIPIYATTTEVFRKQLPPNQVAPRPMALG
jgi:anti-anti-sigma regulatory factor